MEGFIQRIDAYKVAHACKLLGAGREKVTDKIDHSVGIYLNKKHGDFCKKAKFYSQFMQMMKKKPKS